MWCTIDRNIARIWFTGSKCYCSKIVCWSLVPCRRAGSDEVASLHRSQHWQEAWRCRSLLDLASPIIRFYHSILWVFNTSYFRKSTFRKTLEHSVPKPDGLGDVILFSIRKQRISSKIHTPTVKAQLRAKSGTRMKSQWLLLFWSFCVWACQACHLGLGCPRSLEMNRWVFTEMMRTFLIRKKARAPLLCVSLSLNTNQCVQQQHQNQ